MRRNIWVSPVILASCIPLVSGFAPRQLPSEPTGAKTIKTANNVTIRYKEPGKEGVCETTPGVKSYTGYDDLDSSPESHTFFWFFEARHDPMNAPITQWLNGGPGSHAFIGLFQGQDPAKCFLLKKLYKTKTKMLETEQGLCGINDKFESYLNQYSWNEVSNILFLSQPVGVGMI